MKVTTREFLVHPEGEIFKVNRQTCYHFFATGNNTFDIAPKSRRLVEGDEFELERKDKPPLKLVMKQTIYKKENEKLRRAYPLLVTIVARSV